MGYDRPTLMSQVIVQFIHYLMEQSNEPKKATPEQNANVVKQISNIVVDRIIEEEVEKHLNAPEVRLKLEMMAVYRQLSENTIYTKDASTNVLNELGKLTDLVSLYKSRVEKLERSQEQVIIDSSTVDKTIKDLEGKLNILAGQYKAQAERINKLEKLR